MTKQEFIVRVGDEYADNFDEANELYMSLPHTDKDEFCALWKLEKVTKLSIFVELRKWVALYKKEKETSIIFNECCKPFHECNIARELNEKIKQIASAVIKAAEKINN